MSAKRPEYLQVVEDRLASADAFDWEARDAEVARQREAAASLAEKERLRALFDELVEGGAPVKDVQLLEAGKVRRTGAIEGVQAFLEAGILLGVLSGPPGRGKTTASTFWLGKADAPHRRLKLLRRRFASASEIARWPRFDNARVADLTRARALVVDDLGVEFDDDRGAARSFLADVLDDRYRSQLPTLVTTMMPMDRFKERFGRRLMERIREVGEFRAVGGPNLRGGK